MNNKDLTKCIDIALSEFDKVMELNDYSSYLHWSFIFQNRSLIGWSTNRKGDSFVKFGYQEGRRYDHAEPRAYRKCRGIMDTRARWSILNIRLNRKRELALSQPCKICSDFLNACGCSSVYYSNSNAGISKVIL